MALQFSLMAGCEQVGSAVEKNRIEATFKELHLIEEKGSELYLSRPEQQQMAAIKYLLFYDFQIQVNWG